MPNTAKSARPKLIETFNLTRFVRTNKVILIWAAFFGLIYLLRNMFGLLFITFILCFIANSLTGKLTKTTRSGRKFWVVCLYLAFVAIITALSFFIIPRLTIEAKNFADQLPQAITSLHIWLATLADRHPDLAPVLEKTKEALSLENFLNANTGQLWSLVRKTLEKGLHYLSWFFIGTIFSFLIMLDFPSLAAKVKELENTRAKVIYHETADSVVLFAKVVGENFQAQILVSVVNTILTAIGLYILGIGNIALLCTIVFFCGLIPVVGVFISSAPIMLIAINTGGIQLGGGVVIMIVIIHLIEAYVLNPRIVSAVMHIHPVFTFIILYLAHSLIGIWGMLLGVPISVYIYRQLILAPPKIEPKIVNEVAPEAEGQKNS